MTSPIDNEYKLTKLIKQGKSKMNEEFRQLAIWIDHKYRVKTMNIIYDKIEKETRPRLNIIFEMSDKSELFGTRSGFDEVKQYEIASQFEKDVNSSMTLAKYDTLNILIVFSAFEPIAKTETYWRVSKDEINGLQMALNMNDLWTIHLNTFDSPTFFFYTEKQVKKYSNNEIKQLLTKKCFEVIKKFDDFNYFQEGQFLVQIDSKENFESNYKGSWFNYDRR
jgi:hypothetical protein